jgi:hypothetical protein
MSRRPDLREAQPLLPPERVEEVRAVLERILSSHHFRGSRRCQSLLRYITEQTLAGDVQSLKERTLGVEVFGRAPDYDTSQDPVVRATAAEIRKKLAQYYQEPGHESESHIELLTGSYVVEFHFNAVAAVAAPRRRKRHVLIVAVSIAAVITMFAAGLAVERPKRSDLNQLWAPLLQARGPVLFCVGQPIVYNLKSTYAQDAIQGIIEGQAASEHGTDDVIRMKDLLILSDRYVDLGDAVCLAHLASLLEMHGKLYRIRGERSTSFADLSDGPSVLVGAFNNQWTLRANSQLRFTFYKDSKNEIDWVRDRQHPESTAWTLKRAWPYWDVPMDYAIASRIYDATTNRPVIIAAGITRHGTMAAGEFLTNPEYFADAVARFPSGWQKKNLQVVLSVPVVNRVAGRPRVVATYVW